MTGACNALREQLDVPGLVQLRAGEFAAEVDLARLPALADRAVGTGLRLATLFATDDGPGLGFAVHHVWATVEPPGFVRIFARVAADDGANRRLRHEIGEPVTADEQRGVRLEGDLLDVHELRVVRIVRVRADVAKHFVPARMPHRVGFGDLVRVLTLADVAARIAPDAATVQVVEQISELNMLSGTTVRPGQQLIVPVVGRG